jgi:hypothetical protein
MMANEERKLAASSSLIPLEIDPGKNEMIFV